MIKNSFRISMQYARSYFVGNQLYPLVRFHDRFKMIASTERMVRKGIAHVSVEDDEYEGYFIPKQSIIFTNLWYVETRNCIVAFIHQLRQGQSYATPCHIQTLMHSNLSVS
jgi:hypothetical protein